MPSSGGPSLSSRLLLQTCDRLARHADTTGLEQAQAARLKRWTGQSTAPDWRPLPWLCSGLDEAANYWLAGSMLARRSLARSSTCTAAAWS